MARDKSLGTPEMLGLEGKFVNRQDFLGVHMGFKATETYNIHANLS